MYITGPYLRGFNFRSTWQGNRKEPAKCSSTKRSQTVCKCCIYSGNDEWEVTFPANKGSFNSRFCSPTRKFRHTNLHFLHPMNVPLPPDDQHTIAAEELDLLPAEFHPGAWDVICQRGKECFEHGRCSHCNPSAVAMLDTLG
jgi:hypothetical protein